MLEYACDRCGARTESLELRSSPAATKPCPKCKRGRAGRAVSAPLVKIPIVSVSRGKSDPPPGPLTMDTRPLADGMPLKEWRKKRSAIRRDRRRAQNRRELG